MKSSSSLTDFNIYMWLLEADDLWLRKQISCQYDKLTDHIHMHRRGTCTSPCRTFTWFYPYRSTGRFHLETGECLWLFSSPLSSNIIHLQWLKELFHTLFPIIIIINLCTTVLSPSLFSISICFFPSPLYLRCICLSSWCDSYSHVDIFTSQDSSAMRPSGRSWPCLTFDRGFRSIGKCSIHLFYHLLEVLIRRGCKA